MRRAALRHGCHRRLRHKPDCPISSWTQGGDAATSDGQVSSGYPQQKRPKQCYTGVDFVDVVLSSTLSAPQGVPADIMQGLGVASSAGAFLHGDHGNHQVAKQALGIVECGYGLKTVFY